MILIAREWASMCAPAAPARIAAAVTVAVLAAATTGQLGHYRIAWIVLVLAAGGCALLSRAVAEEISQIVELGVELCLVIGGGNIFRGMATAARGMERASADYMGCLLYTSRCV